MKPVDILDALGNIDINYITEAESYKKPVRYTRFMPLAACLLAAVLICTVYIRGSIGYTDGPCIAGESDGAADAGDTISGAPLYEDPGSGEPADGGDFSDGEPAEEGGAPLYTGSAAESDGYIIVQYETVEEFYAPDYEPAPLYIATTPHEDMNDYVSAEFARDMTGITVFRTDEGVSSDSPVWYPVIDDNGISKFYWFCKTKNGYGRGWQDGDEIERAVTGLAHLTSEDDPMYLVSHGEMMFAVVGEYAYYLPTFTFRPDEDYLPEFLTGDEDIEVICIE